MRPLETTQERQLLGGFVNFEGDNAPEFAILSHTWGKDEVTLQDACDPQKDITSMAGYSKIQGACKLAQSYGYEYIWIDTCCIDKTSSAELSEAINSMFGYFYDKNWRLVGSKLDGSFAPTLSSVTGTNSDVLDKTMPLESSSVAERMHWASSRTTTRKEDMAYCLMGIFGVNMPLLYGEGMRAFTRLQEAILQETGDNSIFARYSNYNTSSQEAAFDQHILSGLLVPSPVEFSQFQHLRSLPAFGTTGQQPIQLTNQGFRISMCLEPPDGRGGWDSTPDDFYAVLDCAIQGEDGDHCPRIMLCRLAGNQYARVQTGSVFTMIPAPDSTKPGRGRYKTAFVMRNPAYLLPDVSVLRPGWKATGTRGGMDAYRVIDAYPPVSWVPSLGILRSRDPYWEPVLAALRFESPTNPHIRVDVVVGRRKVGGEWTLWCHACETQEDLGAAVLWRDMESAVTGGFERFPETGSTVRVKVGGESLRGLKRGSAYEVPVDTFCSWNMKAWRAFDG
ncbi:HET-domain-containing protein [Colletotrichum falcatum]|nr:HET-domain-containing protein [Colletotrichum falcatum]